MTARTPPISYPAPTARSISPRRTGRIRWPWPVTWETWARRGPEWPVTGCALPASSLAARADGLLEFRLRQKADHRPVERVVERLPVILDAAGVAVVLGEAVRTRLPARLARG